MSTTDAAPTTPAGPPCPQCGVATRPGARFCRSCGATLTEADPTPAPEPPAAKPAYPPGRRTRWEAQLRGLPGLVAARARRIPRRRRRIIGGALALVVVLFAGTYFVLQRTLYPPDAPVRALFAALAARDTDALPTIDGCGALCEPGALAQGYEPPTGLEVLGVDYDSALPGDPTRRPNTAQATVKVRYQVGGTPYDDVVGVARSNQGWLRPWQIDGAPGGYVRIVSDGLSSATLAAAPVRTTRSDPTADGGGVRYFAPPGVYLATAPASLVWDSTPVRVVVGGNVDRFSRTAGQQIRLDLTVKASVRDVVNRQIHDFLDACARSTDFRPRSSADERFGDCPFSGTEPTFSRNVRWTIVDYPKVEVRRGDDQQAEVHTTTPGRARIDYEWTLRVLEPRDWTAESETKEFTVDGTVTDDNGTVVWSR